MRTDRTFTRRFVGFFTVLVALSGALAAQSARSLADQSPGENDASTPIPSVETSTTAQKGCGPFDPDCRRRLLRILTGIQLVPVEIEGGVRIGDEGSVNGAVRFGVNVGAIETQTGDLRVLPFEAIYIPEAGGFRIRFSIVDTDVLFFCKDQTSGDTSVGLVKAFIGIPPNCRPDGVVGIGGNIGTFQWDTATGRFGARWAEVNLVLNLFGNGNGADYLKKHVNLFVGASLDTVHLNGTPNTDGGWDTMGRLNIGVQGMVRSDDNHWELRGYAGYRPNVIAWDDFAVETKLSLLYRFLFSRDVMGTIGLNASYEHWSIPGHSISTFASDRDRDSFFIGLMFGVNWRGWN